jgi:hypothetical protein
MKIQPWAILLAITSIDGLWAFQQSPSGPRKSHAAVFAAARDYATTSQVVAEEKTTGLNIEFFADSERPSPKETRRNTVLAERWDSNFDALVAFKEKYEHLNVPQKPTKKIQDDYRQLASFVRNVRCQYKYLQNEETRRLSSLTKDRIERLESLGFLWSSHEDAWNSKYEDLVGFWKNNGHCDVPIDKKDLRAWVGYQRLRYYNKKDKFKPLAKRQINLLESIDFRWSPKDEVWWNNYSVLKTFKEENGHFVIGSQKLRMWKNTQRRQCREYILTVSIEGTTDGVHVTGLSIERLDALREIGFCWFPARSGPLKEQPPHDIFAGYQ